MSKLSSQQCSKLETEIRYNLTVDIQSIVDNVAAYCSPEDVFTVKELSEWAEDNGYISGSSN